MMSRDVPRGDILDLAERILEDLDEEIAPFRESRAKENCRELCQRIIEDASPEGPAPLERIANTLEKWLNLAHPPEEPEADNVVCRNCHRPKNWHESGTEHFCPLGFRSQ